MTAEQIIKGIEAEIAELSQPYLVETNEGTFGAAECCDKTGCGDPAFGNYRIYESIDGTRRREGLEAGRKAPGYARKMKVPTAKERRQQVKELRELIATLRQWPANKSLPPHLFRYVK